MKVPADPAPLRRMAYALLITVTAGMSAGRILDVQRVYEPLLFQPDRDPNDPRSQWPSNRPEPMPFLGANDISRWDTVRALVDDHTFAIGHRTVDPPSGKYVDEGIITQDGWKTIDKVLRPGTDDFYSSKPPLLATLTAGEYLALKSLFGWSIVQDRWHVIRTILLTINGLPFIIYLLLLARMLERFGQTDWGRLYVLTAACFGTFLSTFVITLNNHSIATCSALFALYAALRIFDGGTRCPGLFLSAGFFAGFTAAMELPAASFVLGLFLLLVWRAPWRTVCLYVPAALCPAAAFLATNYLAVGQLRPAYSEFGGEWYEFAGAYWKLEPGEIKHGIDWAFQTEGVGGYAFNVLLGHHGLFTLSPIFLFSLIGMVSAVILLARRHPQSVASAEATQPGVAQRGQIAVALLTLALTGVVLVFYICIVNPRNRNYGGWTSGLRWLMWLTPLWLLTMMPVVDWLGQRRWGRMLAYVLLAVSVFSASYPAWNPWRHPWLYDLLQSYGKIHY
jgi:hypothetical protein